MDERMCDGVVGGGHVTPLSPQIFVFLNFWWTESAKG